MNEILQFKKTRQTFIAFTIILLVLLWLVRAFVIPSLGGNEVYNFLSFLISLLDNLIVTLLVTIGIGVFIFWYSEPASQKQFEVIEAFRIKEELTKSRLATDWYYYSGGAGRWTRSVTIPEIAKSARNANQHKELKILTIDPDNVQMCESYANYRKGLKSGLKEDWTTAKVREEIYATIVTAILYKSKENLLQVQIALKSYFSTLRIDMAQLSAVITKEDKQEPAILCLNNTFLYRTYKEEFLQQFKYSKILDTKQNYSSQGFVEATDVQAILSNVNIGLDLKIDDHKRIAEIINENKNPYN